MRTLARQLFDYESADGHARTLLLSATPYKMYTLAAESDHDDHYGDFVKTTEFLLGDRDRCVRDGTPSLSRGDPVPRPRAHSHQRSSAGGEPSRSACGA